MTGPGRWHSLVIPICCSSLVHCIEWSISYSKTNHICLFVHSRALNPLSPVLGWNQPVAWGPSCGPLARTVRVGVNYYHYPFDRGNTDRSEKPSTTLNPILLTRGDGVRGRGDLDDGRSESVVVGFCGLVRTGATLVSRISVVWWERTRSRGGRFRDRLRPGIQLHWDKLPNFMRFGAAVAPEVYLDYRHFGSSYKCCHETTTDRRAIFSRTVAFEVPSHVGRAPEKAGTA